MGKSNFLISLPYRQRPRISFASAWPTEKTTEWTSWKWSKMHTCVPHKQSNKKCRPNSKLNSSNSNNSSNNITKVKAQARPVILDSAVPRAYFTAKILATPNWKYYYVPCALYFTQY